jgi:hypothetical protein
MPEVVLPYAAYNCKHSMQSLFFEPGSKRG